MNDQETSERIADRMKAAFGKALGSMTGREFRISVEPDTGGQKLIDPMIWGQSLGGVPDPCLWVSAGRDLWTSAGQMTLAAVGMDSVTDDDCRSTWQEIVSQTVGGFCTFLTAELEHEVLPGKGDETDREPDSAHWVIFTAACDDDSVWRVKIGWSVALIRLVDRTETPKSPLRPKDGPYSKTLDLLLDVALPVSVSFGRTSLEIREVLKLTTGSIVELNRFMAEPVEVIVNDCVIARGEVVVVDGNYGVRITQLSSREDRLKFGMAEMPARFGAALR
ncbi:MAG: flagellar motor switch protein FliN [Acidobacteriota bacterium]|nr:flagellar motor switch protein FliN [Acidobacteriota bacterium]